MKMTKKSLKPIKPIKAIVFDIGGVLQLGGYSKKPYKEHRALGVHRFMTNKLKISLDQYFDAIDTAYAKAIEGKISEKKALEIISKNLKISEKKLKRLFITAYRKNFKFNNQLFKQALSLKKKGYKIAILSDQWYLSKKAFVSSKLRKNFSPVIISCDVGVRKPDVKIFKLILKKLKMPAQDVLFIDNQQWNVKAAKKLGMKVILFKSNEQTKKALEKFGIR